MDVVRLSCLDGAKTAHGMVILFDVFRASNTIIACLEGGAKYLLPVEALEEAVILKKKNPDHLLFGERGGLPPDGFDYGNSPAETTKLDLTNKKIILTTSAGSQGLVNIKNANSILVGSYANAEALVEYIKEQRPKKVSLVAIGKDASEPAVEDEECSKYIFGLLKGTTVDRNKSIEKIMESDGANRLRRLQQEDDLKYSLKLNISAIIPQYDQTTGKIKGITS